MLVGFMTVDVRLCVVAAPTDIARAKASKTRRSGNIFEANESRLRAVPALYLKGTRVQVAAPGALHVNRRLRQHVVRHS